MFDRIKTSWCKRAVSVSIALIAVLLSGSIGSGEASAKTLAKLYATTSTNRLLSFHTNQPSLIDVDVPITGLAAGEVIGGIDFRPATGELYGVAKGAGGLRIYRIDVLTGAATAINATPFGLAGTAYGISFESATDRIRMVSDSDVNVRINPVNGQISNSDSPLAFAGSDPRVGSNPNVVHLAQADQYSAQVGPTFGIDVSATPALVRLGNATGADGSPNGGQLTTIATMSIDTNIKLGGFDIHPVGDIGYLVVHTGQNQLPSLAEVNLSTGAVAGGQIIPANVTIDGLAISPIDVCADLDGNGKVDALTDGVLYLRALFGMTGTAVTNGAIGVRATRTSWSSIRSWMNGNCGMAWGP